MTSLAAPLLSQLVALHRNIVFLLSDILHWNMVVAFESEMTRELRKVYLKTTRFWLTSDRNPTSAIKINFNTYGVSDHITNDAFTQACNEPHDASIVIGYTPNHDQAEAAIEEHVTNLSGTRVLMRTQST